MMYAQINWNYIQQMLEGKVYVRNYCIVIVELQKYIDKCVMNMSR